MTKISIIVIVITENYKLYYMCFITCTLICLYPIILLHLHTKLINYVTF